MDKSKALKKNKSIDRSKYDKSCYADDDDNIVFEDFARLRMNEPDEWSNSKKANLNENGTIKNTKNSKNVKNADCQLNLRPISM